MSYRRQQRNANKHTERGLSALGSSVQADGWIGAITVAADGETFDGSARIEVAKDALDDAIVVRSDGTKPIVHIREDIPTADDPRAVRLGLAANRIAELNLEWDASVLDGMQGEIDLSGLWNSDELAALLGTEQTTGAGGDDFDTTPDDGPTKVQPGDLWQLGRHRLLCGDSTQREDVERLMGEDRADICFTSPPYNVAAESSLPNKDKYRQERTNTLSADDNRSSDEYLSLLGLFTALALEHSDYVFVNVQSVAGNKTVLIDYLAAFRDKYADTLVWDKLGAEPAMAKNVLNSQYEYIHVFSQKANRAIGTREFRGTLSNVVSINSRQDKEHSDIHKATFPIEFAMFFVESFTNSGEVVLDTFAGVGTTLIVCERSKRDARLIELSPRYCDVILKRWEAETGRTAELLERDPVDKSTG